MIRLSDSEVAYDFDSAWGPPINAIVKASEKWKNLTFKLKFAEYGNDFSGLYVLKGGNIIESKEGTYSEHETYDV